MRGADCGSIVLLIWCEDVEVWCCGFGLLVVTVDAVVPLVEMEMDTKNRATEMTMFVTRCCCSLVYWASRCYSLLC